MAEPLLFDPRRRRLTKCDLQTQIARQARMIVDDRDYICELLTAMEGLRVRAQQAEARALAAEQALIDRGRFGRPRKEHLR